MLRACVIRSLGAVSRMGGVSVDSFAGLLKKTLRGAGRWLLVPCALLKRHPWRVGGGLILLVALVAVSSIFGVFVWAYREREEARNALDRGHNLVAVQHLLSCQMVFSDNPEWLILSARAARRGGAWAEAETFLDRYWKIRGDDDDLVLERLLLRATRGEIEAVRPLLNMRIEANDPSAPQAREALIVGLIYRFSFPEAERELNRWLEREPDRPTALYLKGKLSEFQDATSKALLVYRHCLEVDPDHDESRLRMGVLLVSTRESEEAIPHLEYLHRRFPHNPDVLLNLAKALDLQRRSEEARALLNECLTYSPNNADALAERGRLALRDGDGPAAEDDLRKAVALDPGNFTARYQFSLALKENGKTSEAAKEKETIARIEADITRLTKIVEGELAQNPNDPALYHEIAMISLRAGRPAEALRWLNKGLAVDPNYEPTHRALASFYHETGNPILSAHHRAIAQQLAERKKS